jgi:hypothetical protein
LIIDAQYAWSLQTRATAGCWRPWKHQML